MRETALEHPFNRISCVQAKVKIMKKQCEQRTKALSFLLWCWDPDGVKSQDLLRWYKINLLRQKSIRVCGKDTVFVTD